MTLPNFLIVGAQKCGTTTLYDILNKHPEVNMSIIKEINFFTSEKKYRKGLEYYASFFSAPNKNQKMTGEASPGYMNSDLVAKKIKENLGEIKIIMILRDPIKRALSQYWDNRRHLNENLSEKQILDMYLTENYSQRSKGYFSRGVYMKYINEYLKYFKQENIHIMIFEELIKEPSKHLYDLYKFLGIDTSDKYLKLDKASNSSQIWNNSFYHFFLKNPYYNKFVPMRMRRLLFFGKKHSYKYPALSKDLEDRLHTFYEPWNASLEEFLGRSIPYWKSKV